MSRTLSVVIPAYNVAQYLEECVNSVLSSSYPCDEVIVVDDGSTDKTGELADDISARENRVRVLHTENAGLGAARNAGAREAHGDLLAFVDSDDVVPPDAYATMAAALRESGSSFAVGAVERFNSQKTWEPWFVAEAHSIKRLGVTGEEFPPILWNVFAWSKLFEKDFFDSEIGGFPEGVLYEDQEVSAKMYLSGTKFDIVPQVVYRWRAREDSSSITQNKTNISDLRARLDVAASTADVVDTCNDPAVIEYWYRKLLNEDLWWYYRVVPKTDMQYWNLLRERLTEFCRRAPASAVCLGPSKRSDLIAFCVNGNRNSFIRRLELS